MDQSIQYKNAILHYQITGSGPAPLLIFHGFGQDRQVLPKYLEGSSKKYTLYSFDLFFHGHSIWNYNDHPLEKDFWKQIISQFLQKHRIDQFSVLGFSLGGKFALATLEAFASQVKEIFLIAPDGIKPNLWYSLATYPIVLRSFFKSMILKPQRFQFITTLASKLHFIDQGVIRFAEMQMNTEEKRKQVYYSWVVFRQLKFDVAKIARLINSNDINLVVVIGKYDKIITAKNMGRLLKKVRKHKLEILEAGHTGLLAKLGTL